MYSCFECGSKKNIHHHHVVPQVKGGTKTIPLCMECHGKVHGDHMLKIQKLAWIGRQKKVKENLERGLPSGLGRPHNTSETIEQFLNKPISVEIKRMVLEGYTVKNITQSLSVSNKTVIKVRKYILTK
jgi:DNA-binding NarL/FixJ family response regulator